MHMIILKHSNTPYVSVNNNIISYLFEKIGSEEEPYQGEAVIEMHGNVLSTELPVYGAKASNLGLFLC